MCDPVTLGVAAGVSALSSLATGAMALQQGNFQKRVAAVNAEQADIAARDAMARGRQEELRYARQVSQLKGEQASRMAAAGLDIGFGSPLEIAGDTALIASEDAATIRENALREGRGFSVNALNYRAQGRAARMEGVGRLIGGIGQASSTILGGASQIRALNASRGG